MHNDEVEAAIVEQIKIKLNSLTIKDRQKTISKAQEAINKLELEIVKVNSEMENLINSFTGANSITMDFVNKKMVEYDNHKKELISQIEDLQTEQEKDNSKKIQELTNVMEKWDLGR